MEMTSGDLHTKAFYRRGFESSVSIEWRVGGHYNLSGLFGEGKSLAPAWNRTHDTSVL